ncbi:MAG: class I SAM-dependent methyltransferase [Vicinamibacterales bacterium]
MQGPGPVDRQGEYAARGDYHRAPAPDWDYYPTYLAKLDRVRRYLDAFPDGTRVLDAGCGEGVLVDRYWPRLAIVGVDSAYSSELVRTASLTALPFADASFDCALCLDVLEHLSYAEQQLALVELHRVIRPGGELLLSVPNLAHLQSRVHFLLKGALIRTASERKHPGDRPVAEYLWLARNAGFELRRREGIFPTVPLVARVIRRHPARLRRLHDLLTALVPVPGWCFLNLLLFVKEDAAGTPGKMVSGEAQKPQDRLS